MIRTERISEHEYIVVDDIAETRDLMMPRLFCNFPLFSYVFLFKPSKNARIRTKVTLKQVICPTVCRCKIECEDGKFRYVSMVGSFCVAGNVFNQRGESLGPNNLDYYIKSLDFKFDKTQYDIKFSESDYAHAKEHNDKLK